MKTNSTLKSMILGMALFCISMISFAQVDVTFKVDMTGVDMTNATGVYIVGQLNSWVHSEMTLESENVYAVTLSLDEGTDPIYYYTIATDWAAASREVVPAECSNSISKSDGSGWDGDRLIVVPAEATIVAEPYGGCALTTGLETGEDISQGTAIAVNSGIEVNVPVISEVKIVSIDGKLIWQKTQEGKELVPCKQGLYIVLIGNKASKVMVRN